MNVYDFDGTIYAGDSTVDFWKYCVRKYPEILLALPAAVLYGAAFRLGLCPREVFKEKFYTFLRFVPNVHWEVEQFWDEEIKKVAPWYLEQHYAADVIISASPEFLIQPVCRRLNVACIASKVNPKTGRLEGPNCRGREKVLRFYQQYPDGTVDKFYSDSRSDRFMAEISKCAFLVKKGTIQKWEDSYANDCDYLDKRTAELRRAAGHEERDDGCR